MSEGKRTRRFYASSGENVAFDRLCQRPNCGIHQRDHTEGDHLRESPTPARGRQDTPSMATPVSGRQDTPSMGNDSS